MTEPPPPSRLVALEDVVYVRRWLEQTDAPTNLPALLRRAELWLEHNRPPDREVWDAIAELRDEVHDLAGRVDHVHRHALRALTDAMKGRDDVEATRHTDRG